MTKEEELYIATGQKIKGAVQSQMFGKTCFKIGGKTFVAFFQNEMVFKLTGDEHTKALTLKGAQLFDPSGKKRPMKEWVQVPGAHASKWPELTKAAATYVGGASS